VGTIRAPYTATVAESHTKLEYDLYYVRHASLLLEMRILLQTALVVITLKGR